MGIIDNFKPKRKSDDSSSQSLLKQALDAYTKTLEQGDKRVAELHGVVEGLDERDTMILFAANDGLIPVPPHLSSRLEDLERILTEGDRIADEAGEDDNLGAALRLLRRQPWWPEFIGLVQAETGIRTADGLGVWRDVYKKVAPYVYEVRCLCQTLDNYRSHGPVSTWAWRVDVKARTTEALSEYDECVDRLADKVIGLSFAMWSERDSIGEVLQTVRDRGNIDWSMVALEHMLFYQHLIDRYSFSLYGAEFRATVMDSLYDPLIRKFAETGAVRVDRLVEFRSMFIDKLNERNVEYANCRLDAEMFEGSLFWQLGKRIDAILGGTNPLVVFYVQGHAIAGLAVIGPSTVLKKLKDLIDADKME